MAQLWTVIFVTLLAIAFGIATWLDHKEKKQQERKNAAHEKVERTVERDGRRKC